MPLHRFSGFNLETDAVEKADIDETALEKRY